MNSTQERTDEKNYVEEPLMAHLKHLGWEVLHGEDPLQFNTDYEKIEKSKESQKGDGSLSIQRPSRFYASAICFHSYQSVRCKKNYRNILKHKYNIGPDAAQAGHLVLDF